MSKFMQSIVQEVLSRNKTPETSDWKETEQKSKPSHPLNLEDLHRPNYQRQKQQERIKVENSAISPRSQIPMEERRAEDPMSTLQTLTTSQLFAGKSAPTVHGSGKGAQLIGKTKNNQQVWCFYAPDPRLEAVPKGCSSGFVTGALENPGTVFLIEEWIKQRPDVHWDWFGVKNAHGWADTIKLGSRESQDIVPVLKGLYNQLNRQAIRPMKSYFVESPSDSLWGSLSFSARESVSALVGVSYISAIALLDRYFHHHPQVSFQFDVHENHLLLCGDSRMIQGTIQQLEDDAVQLLS